MEYRRKSHNTQPRPHCRHNCTGKNSGNRYLAHITMAMPIRRPGTEETKQNIVSIGHSPYISTTKTRTFTDSMTLQYPQNVVYAVVGQSSWSQGPWGEWVQAFPRAFCLEETQKSDMGKGTPKPADLESTILSQHWFEPRVRMSPISL